MCPKREGMRRDKGLQLFLQKRGQSSEVLLDCVAVDKYFVQ